MMMAEKSRCQCCGRVFVPDKRVGQRQKTCSAACRQIRKSDSNRSFRRRNPDYWLDRYDVVKAWRMDHPGYQKTWRRKRKERRKKFTPDEIQAEMFSKALDTVQKNVYLLREIQAGIPLQLINFRRKLSFYPCRPS